VLATIENEPAGRAAWPDATDEPYRLLFFLSKPVWTDVAVASLPQYFGKVYQGLRRLRHSDRILDDYDSLDRFVSDVLLGGSLPATVASTDEAPYAPSGQDTRQLVERQIRARRGQQQFRDALRRRFNDQCAVSGCRLLPLLEAAHIAPYRGEHDNHPENGLLLRADLHTLYDLDLLAIHPDSLVVELHPAIVGEYGDLTGRILATNSNNGPSKESLAERHRRFVQRCQHGL
jgi:hypothetical protein